MLHSVLSARKRMAPVFQERDVNLPLGHKFLPNKSTRSLTNTAPPFPDPYPLPPLTTAKCFVNGTLILGVDDMQQFTVFRGFPFCTVGPKGAKQNTRMLSIDVYFPALNEFHIYTPLCILHFLFKLYFMAWLSEHCSIAIHSHIFLGQ